MREYDIYQVARGDTLSKIAQQHDVNADELASLNQIREPNFIYVGQRIKIPHKPTQREQGDSFYSELWLRFVDAIGNPIANLGTRVASALGEYRFTTDELGLLPPVQTAGKDDQPRVFVQKIEGGEKEVASLRLPPGTHQVTLRSPKQKLEFAMRRHHGLPDLNTHKPLKLEHGQVSHNRDLGGNPVVNVGVECPNKDNLRLGPNDKYRKCIIDAAKRAGIEPQAVAAIINAEAGKIRVPQTKQVYANGKPLKNKDGTPKTVKRLVSTGEWDPTSAANTSSARGLTQFLDGTWITMAATDGAFLNERAKSENWIITSPENKFLFVLADKKPIPLNAVRLMKNVVARTQANDANIQALLDLRNDPECAIHTAVDYANGNAKSIERSGYALQSLNSTERAKVMYASHHLGLKDVLLFIQQNLPEERAERLLITQIGKVRAEIIVNEHGSYVAAHRNWLNDFVEINIKPQLFSCDPSSMSPGRTLLEITSSLRKQRS
ncbi:LysM peptidoglycan-binding domain-containing protein [Trinickia sp. LjRoot230]|uniref:LysM peptidoglycan-binding domain-containing protein n=1 Tax=Trinickia sp. LjRoot230 TaxID=3342288 RepID=UPI003ECC9DF3